MDGESKITNEIGMQMCKFCFDSIIAKLEKKKLPNFDDFGIPNDKYPLFVTWLIGKNKDLRGCIGTFSEQSISKNLQKYALISAFQDSRFDPISKGEVKKLNCGVSLLCNFQDIDDPLDWVVGKHGIEIDFEHDGEKYSATFLPEVAEEENWNQEETLEYLINKAGYEGSLDEVINQINIFKIINKYRFPKIECRTYESLKFNMTYDEYLSASGEQS